jgi:hypothetical protein
MRATQSDKSFLPVSYEPTVHPVQLGQWEGLQSKKWQSNRRHYGFAYKDQIEYTPAGSYNFRPTKRIVDVPRTGKEMIERSSIKVADNLIKGIFR